MDSGIAVLLEITIECVARTAPTGLLPTTINTPIQATTDTAMDMALATILITGTTAALAATIQAATIPAVITSV